MDRFLIITNPDKDPGYEVTEMVSNYLTAHGKETTIRKEYFHSTKDEETENLQYISKPDCILVLGGDGTLLKAAREMADEKIPLLGINLGNLGYLASTGPEDMITALDKLMTDRFVPETRMMLEGKAYHNGKTVLQDRALNDIVVTRNGRLRVLDFDIYVNDRYLNSYSADGLIIATPTGSTGYNLSVGGPIVEPSASMILLTPVSPHTLTARSVILEPSADIRVVIRRRGQEAESASMICDGNTYVDLTDGDVIEVVRSDREAILARTDQISFLEVLRNKMSGK